MKDLRKDFKYSSKPYKMSKGHTKAFENKLDKAFATQTRDHKSLIYKIAAVLVVALLSTVFIMNQNQFLDADAKKQNNSTQTASIGLGDLSPELQTVEDYYLTSIKVELATIETSAEHEALVNSYLEELKNINKAYNDLEKDLNEIGISEEIINAMIENLQLRLELLQDLKDKLNNLKQKQDEKNVVYQI
jgi:hypothetical protein